MFGKAGRAETATDPAPLTMIETTIKLKPREQWRPGMTLQKLKAELDARVQVPSLNNAWLMPIKTRIDMQSTGINTPVGIKIAGPDLTVIEDIGEDIERVLHGVEGTQSVYSERTASARYIDIEIDRHALTRYSTTVEEIQEVINTAVGGVNVMWTVEGRERYPVNLRYPRHVRDSVDKLRDLPIVTASQEEFRLRDVAEVRVVDGPPVIRSEDARLNGRVYVTIADRDLGSYIAAAQQAVQEQVTLPPGYTLTWAGQYEYMQRAAAAPCLDCAADTGDHPGAAVPELSEFHPGIDGDGRRAAVAGGWHLARLFPGLRAVSGRGGGVHCPGRGGGGVRRGDDGLPG